MVLEQAREQLGNLTKIDTNIGFGDNQVTDRNLRLNKVNPNSIRPDGIPVIKGDSDAALTYPPAEATMLLNDTVSPDAVFSYVRFQAFHRVGNQANLQFDASDALTSLNPTDINFSLTATGSGAENSAITQQQTGTGRFQAAGLGGAGTATGSQLVAAQGVRRFSRVENEKPSDVINLYIPNELSFSDTVSYNEQSTGDVGRILEGVVGGNTRLLAETAGLKALNKVDQFASKLVDGLDQTIRARFGFVQNPREEALFNNTNLKKFDMKFSFAPRNKSEVEIVYNIIEAFRFHMMPELSPSSAVLFSPAEFEIDFLYRDASNFSYVENQSLPKLGRCFLTSTSVDYSPNPKSSFFMDGTATEINLSLDFLQAAHLNRQMIMRGF